MNDRTKELGQFNTRQWVATRLVEKYFPDIGINDVGLDPTCGTGAFLAAIPPNVPAFGVEIDPIIVPQAKASTGRDVICGDFRQVELKVAPTFMVGNPPFRLAVFMQIMDRAHSLLPEGAKAGFVLPAYMMQTPSKVCRFAERWSMTAELLPRNIFDGLSKPLIFCMFTKEAQRILVGFTLYSEVRDVESMRKEYREVIGQVSGSVWASALAKAIASLGGSADLDEIYRAMEPKRPTGNRWWKEQVRKVAQKPPFQRTGPARYSLALQEAA